MADIEHAELPPDGPAAPAATPDAAAAALGGSVRCVLSDRGLLAFRGRDAAGFLNSQLSTDVHALTPGQSTLTSYSDPRGRLLAVGRLYALPDRLLLELPADVLAATRERLARYVLRADVAITDESPEWARIGAAGQSAAVALYGLLGALPDIPGSATGPSEDVRVVCVGGSRPRWQILGPPATVAALWEGLAADTTEADAEAWRLLDLEAGLPTVHTETAGHFVAQMLNLDRLGALDFGKGCYPGQEVIARTHYLGRIKRRMRLLHAGEGSDATPPGTAVYVGDAQAGEIVDAAPHPSGGCLALAVLREGSMTDLRLASADGPAAECHPLPYAIDEQAA
jgi:folate-binding protein YgfZ